jgi:hypothetical protein
MKPARDKVSFKIRLAAFQASGGADTETNRLSCLYQKGTPWYQWMKLHSNPICPSCHRKIKKKYTGQFSKF